MRRRGNLIEWLWNSVQRGERRIIRVMVLASVILVLIQLGTTRDPVQFYIAMAERVESRALDLPSLTQPALAESLNSWNVTLIAIPAAPIRVLQNGTVIATLGQGEQQITVQSGQFQLDGIGISQLIQVQVLKKDPQLLEPRQNQVFVVQGNMQNIRVSP